ncbi:hypothetical protein ACN0IJ_00625 [Shewanella indica]|uniref:hypothetical protein n=1 Tax=Shewanella indica TaxID=768528 RepID=UPI003D36A019
MKNIIIAVFLTGLVACSSTPTAMVFDGSSAESTQRGVISIMRTLNSHDKQEFVMALMKIQHAEFDSPLAAMKHSDQAGQIDFALVGKKNRWTHLRASAQTCTKTKQQVKTAQQSR